ncbi:MAG: hypothetical protein J3K34DRAFT_369535 [Monoraphidium minutum]|nr:MAG: hypothetical protein J3K34DRAFT_369535 [Monoraphidium minutum]
MCIALDLVAADPRDPAFAARLQAASLGVRALFRAHRTCTTEIVGTPAAFARLRSEGLALWHGVGGFSMMLNLIMNEPSELNARLALTLGGARYEVDPATGAPGTGWPGALERWRMVAANSVANADFFGTVIAAFLRVFLGWDEEAGVQVDATCVFGRVSGYVFKFETSTRGALHAHGLIVQPDLAPARLRTLLGPHPDAAAYRTHLESLSCMSLPKGCVLRACDASGDPRPVDAPADARDVEPPPGPALAAAHEVPLYRAA